MTPEELLATIDLRGQVILLLGATIIEAILIKALFKKIPLPAIVGFLAIGLVILGADEFDCGNGPYGDENDLCLLFCKTGNLGFTKSTKKEAQVVSPTAPVRGREVRNFPRSA